MKKRILSLIALLALIIGMIPALSACNGDTPHPDVPPDDAVVEPPTDTTEHVSPEETPADFDTTMTASRMADEIVAGWNLGNTFDAVSSGDDSQGFAWLGGGRYEHSSVLELETAWLPNDGADVTTREFIDAIYAAGFNAIRIPVSWHKVTDASIFGNPNPTYNIREDWMERVLEVAGWAADNNMFIIINTHHENRVFTLTDETFDESMHFFVRVWEQIAKSFMDFNERLVFAGLNEPRGIGSGMNEWGGGIEETRSNLNRLNQAFVDTVRASGGNNAYRVLLVPTHAAGSNPQSLAGFEVPNDPGPAEDRIAMAVHTYSPFDWAHEGRGSYPGPEQIYEDIGRVLARAEELGVQAMLTEWGSINTTTHIEMSENHLERIQHAYDYVRIAREMGMPTFWWDNGQAVADAHGFGIINRQSAEFYFPRIVEAILIGDAVGRGEREPALFTCCDTPDDCDCFAPPQARPAPPHMSFDKETGGWWVYDFTNHHDNRIGFDPYSTPEENRSMGNWQLFLPEGARFNDIASVRIEVFFDQDVMDAAVQAGEVEEAGLLHAIYVIIQSNASDWTQLQSPGTEDTSVYLTENFVTEVEVDIVARTTWLGITIVTWNDFVPGVSALVHLLDADGEVIVLVCPDCLASPCEC